MVTTIKIHTQTKQSLDRLKQNGDSYDAIIGKLLHARKHATLKEQLIAQYQAMTDDEFAEFKEWEAVDL